MSAKTCVLIGTPGDWFVGGEGTIPDGVVINAEVGQGVLEGIAELYPRPDKRDMVENAFLMANAKKLYHAVDVALMEIQGTPMALRKVNALGVRLQDFLENALAAAQAPSCAFEEDDA